MEVVAKLAVVRPVEVDMYVVEEERKSDVEYVAIVPRPRFVLAVEVLFRSERLLRTFSQVELARVAVSANPKFVRADAVVVAPVPP